MTGRFTGRAGVPALPPPPGGQRAGAIPMKSSTVDQRGRHSTQTLSRNAQSQGFGISAEILLRLSNVDPTGSPALIATECRVWRLPSSGTGVAWPDPDAS
jgi:hypothetical protein